MYPLKVNLGCGYDIKEGYLNVDLNDHHNPDLVADVTDLHMLPDQYFEEIIACDVLEHIGRTKTIAVLIEWNRILKNDGIIHIQVPSIIDLIEMLKANRRNIPKSMELIQCCFGTQNYTGDYHFTSFTEELLTYQLGESGFKIIKLTLRDGWLFECVAKKVKNVIFSEYRKKDIDDYTSKVNELYVRILRRDADSEGLHYYVQQLIDSSITLEAIGEALLASNEYKGRLEGN